MKKYKKNSGGNLLLKTGMVWAVLLVATVLMFFISIAIGSVRFSLPEIWYALWHEDAGNAYVIIYSLRLPRALLAILVGASLSSAGALLQAVMRNPLADPGTIGVSAGAGTAAITILLLFPNMTLSVPLFAFIGAAIACVLIYLLAWNG